MIKSNRRNILIVLLTCLLFLILILIFSGKYLILGGEGNYVTEFGLIRSIDSSSWVQSLSGTGSANPTMNNLVGLFDIFVFLQKIGISLKIINTISVFMVYMLPFLSILWLFNKVLKIRFPIAYIVAFFYILNPFSTYHLQGIMFWNTAPFFVLPVMFGIMYRYYLDKPKLFLLFGLLSALFSFSFSNIPYFGLFHVFLIISIILIPYIRAVKPNLKTIVSNIFVTELSLFLFNAWWLINLIRYQMYDLGDYTTKYAVTWAGVSSGINGIILKILTLKTLITVDKGSFFSDFYNSIPVTVVLFIPIFIIVWNLYLQETSRNITKVSVHKIIAGFILLVMFLNKGLNKPFEGVYMWLLDHIPLFIIFKSPLEKFGVLLVFLISLALVMILNSEKKRWPYYLLTFYLIVCSVPYLAVNFIPDVKFAAGKYISRRYIDKEDYFRARESLNTDKLDYRMLSLPGSTNYQVTLLNHDGNKYFRGMDPFIFSVNKPFVTAYTGPLTKQNDIFTHFSNPIVEEKLLNLYSIKKVALDKDMFPAFGYVEEERPKKVIDILSQTTQKKDFNSILIFDRKNFIPHLSVETGKPTLEYRKISPTKYRIIIHGAKADFPLLFNETYHKGWKLYPITSLHQSTKSLDIKRYKIFDGNAADQATQKELKEYIDSGRVSYLGDGKVKQIIHHTWKNGEEKSGYTEKFTIDFISKDFHGTIQNDNLPSGTPYETWFKKPLDEKNHILVNGYANSWTIHPDGNQDFELIMEFWPERLFYLGLLISGLAAVSSTGYLIFTILRKRK